MGVAGALTVMGAFAASAGMFRPSAKRVKDSPQPIKPFNVSLLCLGIWTGGGLVKTARCISVADYLNFTRKHHLVALFAKMFYKCVAVNDDFGNHGVDIEQ